MASRKKNNPCVVVPIVAMKMARKHFLQSPGYAVGTIGR